MVWVCAENKNGPLTQQIFLQCHLLAKPCLDDAIAIPASAAMGQGQNASAQWLERTKT